jgi:hypothetical protein
MTNHREEEERALRQAQALQIELARVVRRLVAEAQQSEVRSYHALLPMMVLAGQWMVLELYDSVWAELGKLPERVLAGMSITCILSLLPILLLIAPTEIIPRWRAARVRRRFAPPPRHLGAAERCARLAASLEAALAALPDSLARHVPESLFHD